MTPKERADDIMGRCWWRPEEHPGELRPLFAGLGPEIEAAIREAVAERTEAAASLADEAEVEAFGKKGVMRQYIGSMIRAMKEAE